MNYVTNNNNHPFSYLDLFDSKFQDTFFGVASPRYEKSVQTDLAETEEYFVLSLDVPGFEVKDISISLQDKKLTIQGRKDEETQFENVLSIRKERGMNEFKKSYSLHADIEEESIKAELKNGVLRLALKKAAKPEAKEIKVLESHETFFKELLEKK